jgi:hypothetical protein
MTYRFTAAANAEMAAALKYYEEAASGLGAKFLDEVEAGINRVLSMPLAWKPLSRRTRRCLLRRFPFGIIYQIRGDEILVVSVMDLRRDPERWQKLI